jgi:hypothetical protein
MSNTIPGGYYWNTVTKRHEDAWGNPVEKHSDAEIKKAKEDSETLTPDQAEILAREAQTKQRASELQAAAAAAAAQAKTAAVQPRARAGRRGR